MNLILLFPEDFVGGSLRVVLKGRRQKQVLSVHRAKVGQELSVGLVNGQIGRGKICRLDKEILEMEVTFERHAPRALGVTLILALPRPPVLKRVLLTATSMGVKKIFLVNSFRVEKTYWKSHALRESEIREQLVLGLEQAKDTVLPEVLLRPRFKPFVEDELPQLISGARALVAHPGTGRLCPSGVSGPVFLGIGPEGGFIPFEIECLCRIGFEPVQLGERILRVESAVPAFLARIA